MPAADSLVSAVLRSLRHRNFRLFTIGQSVSLLGTWMQIVAVGWLVYRLTDSALLLGLVAFAGQGPTFVLAPIAGAIADRANRQRVLLIVQSLMMVQALILGTLVLTGAVEIWHVLLLSGLLGCLSGFDIPIRQTFLVEMVEGREDLSNAIALNSSMFNAARLVGPALAGVGITLIGEGWCILLNGLSYIAVIGALLAMRLPPRPLPGRSEPMLDQIREGFRYAFGFGPIRAVLLLIAIVSLLGVPFSMLLPIVAGSILHGDAKTLGALVSATGAGALTAALYLASRQTVRGLGALITGSSIMFGAALILFSLSRELWISVTTLVIAGFGMMLQMASSNTFLQTIVDDDKRGRILALYTMAYIGVSPLGSLLMGWVAHYFGAPRTILIGGIACLLGGVAFGTRLETFRAQVRPIYRKLGIIPEVATGLQAATQTQTSEETR
jgi:MFS family permease